MSVCPELKKPLPVVHRFRRECAYTFTVGPDTPSLPLARLDEQTLVDGPVFVESVVAEVTTPPGLAVSLDLFLNNGEPGQFYHHDADSFDGQMMVHPGQYRSLEIYGYTFTEKNRVRECRQTEDGLSDLSISSIDVHRHVFDPSAKPGDATITVTLFYHHDVEKEP
jgi:hypothetical protein